MSTDFVSFLPSMQLLIYDMNKAKAIIILPLNTMDIDGIILGTTV